jgi:plastocyanin
MGTTRPTVGVVRPLLAALAVGLVTLAVSLAGCGGGGTDSSSSSAATSSGAGSDSTGSAGADAVTIKDYLYEPADITVPVGTTVKFTNQDSTPHTATSKEAGVFESGPIKTGKTGTIKLEKAGTYQYYCVFHPFMSGTITVK